MDAPPPARSPKLMPESRRHREVHVRYGAVFKDIPSLPNTAAPEAFALSSNYAPQQSKDASLAAYAQLACLHSATSRAIVSLFDDSRQYVIAEAAPGMLLRPNRLDMANNALWLGAVGLPRNWTPCETVLRESANPTQNSEAIVTFNDLAQDDRYAQRPFVTASPCLRFYAGVPLTSAKGAVIGTLSVMDDKPRPGLNERQILHLQDLAATVVDYLNLYMVKDQQGRSERLMRALMSFAEGDSNMRPFENESQRLLSPTGSEIPEPRQEKKEPALAKSRKASPLRTPAKQTSTRQSSMKQLQESILPKDSRSMFSRAASVIQKSSDLDGVLILDASIVGRVRDESLVASDDDGDVSSSGDRSSSPEENEEYMFSPLQRRSSSAVSKKTARVLGFATKERSDFRGDSPLLPLESFPERDLARLFRTYPDGRVIDISLEGDPISSTDDSDSSTILGKPNVLEPEAQTKRKTEAEIKAKCVLAIRNILPEALSVAFAPLWDYERSRWFAGCLCWSNRVDRKLSEKVDLAYVKIFGHSIMTDLSRLDALAANRSKTSFVASISHELRSPLHGILGTLRFLEDTALDPFQISMINSLGACGRTLLDTIDHVLDYANVTATKKSKSSLRRPRGLKKGINVSTKSSNSRWNRASETPTVDLQQAAEETIEAVISGQTYALLQADDWDASSPDPSPRRRNRHVILDFAAEDSWDYQFSRGSWRRLVMNLVGNALKYTGSGYIHISLRSSDASKGMDGRIVHLAIKDTGQGMSQQFLANHAFQPFKQEDPYSSGTGLGLSIVRQIVDLSDGTIGVESAPGAGTEIRIQVTLPSPEPTACPQPQLTQFMTMLPQFEGKRICILHQPTSTEPDAADAVARPNGINRFTAALEYTLRKHLKMDVFQTDQWDAHDADLVICPEPYFAYLASIRRRRTIENRAPVTIFVAMDALEASTLRTDARVESKESVVEIMAQPCGPYKLARVLDCCLNRFASPEENIWSPPSSSQSPLPSLPHPLPIRNASVVSSTNADVSVPSLSCDNSTSDVSAAPHESSLTSLTTNNISVDDFGSSKVSAVRSNSIKARPTIGLRHATMGHTHMERDSATSPMTERSFSGFSATSNPSDQTSKVSRVLIVDDNPINRRLLVTFLKKKNILHAEAENGAEAVLKYQQASPVHFDVILMDISMPVLDGMSASREIRDHEQKSYLPRACIIALTGLASSSARLEAWSAGIDHYMTKPLNFKKLEELLAEEGKKKIMS